MENKLDIQSIEKKILQISDALEWILQNRPEQYQQKFLQLVPLRCELRKILRAEEEKPAIAAYGESQKGKSYLMGNLLQKNGAPFMVRTNGKDYDFVASINPIGDKREATGVVTRFTSYIGYEERASDSYPARMKVMSAANIVTILVDGYFNDIIDDKRYSDKEIQDRADKIYDKYAADFPVQDIFTEDDVVDIKLYLQNFVNRAKVSAFCESTDFFNKIALVIRNIPLSEWADVFSILWHDNRDLTELFVRLLGCLQRMNFARVIYLPIEALLHHGENKNTIMSVECLNGLYPYKKDLETCTDIYVKENESYRCLRGFDKSELSALCLEVAFRVDVRYLDDRASFSYDLQKAGLPGYMSSDTYAKLTGNGEFVSKRRLLESSDLLDFPGAKNREQMKEDTLNRFDNETQQTNLVKLYLRGKVSFLFNFFSDSKALNILLFCHNAEDVKVTQMYNVIDKWITTYVGSTPEAREKTMRLAGNVAPFFAIGTMFNIDMMQKKNSDANSAIALKNRWNGRFSKVMYQDCFHAGTDVDWFKNWSGPGKIFQNVYVLRDFKYSGCDGQGNNLYRGYDESADSPHETSLALSEEFYENIKDSFVNDADNVGRFMKDPKVAWESAATMNNDGSLYIIQQLCIAAENMVAVRDTQFSERACEIASAVLEKIKGYYQEVNGAAKLEKHLEYASSVLCQFDAASGDNSFFGKFIDMLQISDDEAYSIVHEIIGSPELIEVVNRFPEYELIMTRLPECHSEEEVLEEYARVYRMASPEAARDFLTERGIDPKNLISGRVKSKRKNSYMIADALVRYWREKLSSASFLSKIIADSRFDMGVMSNLIENTLDMADTVDITDKMSMDIAEYVNVVAIATANEFLVSDILRHSVNSFVTDLGFSLLPDGRQQELKNLALSRNVQISGYIGKDEKSDYSEEELTQLFNEISEQSGPVGLPFYKHYNIWLEYMFLSFLATAGNVTVIQNPAANNRIGEIISGLNETL